MKEYFYTKTDLKNYKIMQNIVLECMDLSLEDILRRNVIIETKIIKIYLY